MKTRDFVKHFLKNVLLYFMAFQMHKNKIKEKGISIQWKISLRF